MEALHQASIPCPQCGQSLVVPTHDLQHSFQCPRCGAVHIAGNLIPTYTPIAAVPVALPAAATAAATASAAAPATASAAAAAAASAAAAAPAPATASAPATAPAPATAFAPAPATAPAPGGTAAANEGLRPYAPMGLPPVDAAGASHSRPAAGPLGRLGAFFLSVSDRIDAALYGARITVVTLVAAITVIGTAVEARLNPRAPLFTALSTFAFALLLSVLFIARLGSLRDESGAWSFALVRRRASALLADIGESLSAFGAMPWALRFKAMGKFAIIAGLIDLSLRNTVTLFIIILDELFELRLAQAESLDHALLLGGVGTLAFGLFLWLLGFYRLRKHPEHLAFRPDARGREALIDAISTLPPVIDCADAGAVRALAKKAGHPLLAGLFEALAGWRPSRFKYEDEYQASLHRLLKRKMPETNPVRERPLGKRSEGTAGRADIVLSDTVMLEMKRGLNTSSAQRALGQIYMYLRAWKHGPIFLVLCDADPAMAKSFLGKEIAELRSRAPVTLVLAGRK